MIRFFSLSISFLYISQSWAGNFAKDYDAIKNNGEKYQVIGVICEQVAKLRLQEKYPAPQYEVLTGIEYFEGKRTVGELDVTVLDNSQPKPRAVVVSEVKCWKNLDNARKKALDQRQRFQTHIAGNQPIRIQMNHGDRRKFSREQFLTVSQYLAISQSGGEASGFEMTLDYSLEELMEMRRKIMECQERRECRAPEM